MEKLSHSRPLFAIRPLYSFAGVTSVYSNQKISQVLLQRKNLTVTKVKQNVKVRESVEHIIRSKLVHITCESREILNLTYNKAQRLY